MLNGVYVLKWIENYRVIVLRGMVLRDRRYYCQQANASKCIYEGQLLLEIKMSSPCFV